MPWLRRGAVVFAALLLAAVVGAYGVAVSSLPRTSGSLDLPGLYDTVEVARDERGVPVITAANSHDTYLALGFVHAQDRLFQMEFLRRLASGRVAEAIGPAGLPGDRFMRTLGLRQAAESGLAAVDRETRQALDAYASGVNAFLTTRNGPLPPEFLLLRLEPEPWTPVDSLLWQRLMALRLSGNWHEEALRAALLGVLPPDRVAELWPAEGDDAPTTLGALPAALAGPAFAALLDAWPPALAPTLASNVWAVDGARSATGAPLLANDPHLGLGLPNLWYLAEVRTPEWRVAGATVPGVPFHVLGHNGHLAWGLTTTHSDTMDLFLEDAAGPGHYAAPGGPEAFSERTETIAVRGGATETLVVRATRHGPVVGDLLDVPLPEGSVLALSAAALAPGDRTAEALRRLNRAQAWDDAVTALEAYHAPQQNIVVADSAGTIGFIAPGRVPVRRSGRGLVPRPGADGAFDWKGWLPFAALPRGANPSAGRLVNANNKPVPEDYPHLLAVHWPPPYRAERIEAVLGSLPDRATPDAMRRLQVDSRSGVFQALWPLMADTRAAGPAAAEALVTLAGWNGVMDAGRPEPLLFTAWRLTLERAVFADDLGALYDRWQGSHPHLLSQVLAGETRAPWCDDITTPRPETCADQLEASLAATLDSLGGEFGPPEGWRWGDAHAVTLEHPVFGRIPGLTGLTTLRAELDGGEETVNRGGFSGRGESWRHRLERVHGAGLRAVYDLADLGRSGFVIAAGQSGHPLSPHYRDFMADWAAGRLRPLPSGAASAVLTLTPLRSTR